MEHLEDKVQVAAAWVQFDTLKSEIEAFRNQVVIQLGKMIEKAEQGKQAALKLRALPKDPA